MAGKGGVSGDFFLFFEYIYLHVASYIVCVLYQLSLAVFRPQLWDRNGSGTQPGARVHTCSTGSGRSGTSRPPRDVIAVEWFRNGSGWLCGVNAQPDAFRSRLASLMKNMQYIFPKEVYPAKNRHTLMDMSISALASKHLARVSNPDAIQRHPVFRNEKTYGQDIASPSIYFYVKITLLELRKSENWVGLDSTWRASLSNSNNENMSAFCVAFHM